MMGLRQVTWFDFFSRASRQSLPSQNGVAVDVIDEAPQSVVPHFIDERCYTPAGNEAIVIEHQECAWFCPWDQPFDAKPRRLVNIDVDVAE
jgi:hypothetical protein